MKGMKKLKPAAIKAIKAKDVKGPLKLGKVKVKKGY